MIVLTLDPVLAGALLTVLLTLPILLVDAWVRGRGLRRRLDAALAREGRAAWDAVARQRVMEGCPRCGPWVDRPRPGVA